MDGGGNSVHFVLISISFDYCQTLPQGPFFWQISPFNILSVRWSPSARILTEQLRRKRFARTYIEIKWKEQTVESNVEGDVLWQINQGNSYILGFKRNIIGMFKQRKRLCYCSVEENIEHAVQLRLMALTLCQAFDKLHFRTARLKVRGSTKWLQFIVRGTYPNQMSWQQLQSPLSHTNIKMMVILEENSLQSYKDSSFGIDEYVITSAVNRRRKTNVLILTNIWD